MNRLEKIQERMRRLALARAWEESAEQLGEELEQEAREELAQTGTRPSWSAPDVAEVVLPLTKTAVVVDNIDDLKKWTAATHPENIRTVTEVQPAYQKWLLENAEITADGAVAHPVTKEPIAGLRVRQGGVPMTLRFTPNKVAAGLYANYARQAVADHLAAEYGVTEAVA